MNKQPCPRQRASWRLLMLLTTTACGSAVEAGAAATAGQVGAPATESAGETETTAGADVGDAPSDGAAAADTAADDSNPVVYDVATDNNFCQDHGKGIHCRDNVAIECDADGGTTDTRGCAPGVCLDSVGCVVCVDGQYDCQGDQVMRCNANSGPARWEAIETCDSSAGLGCNLFYGKCGPIEPIGSSAPSGVYYQYDSFELDDGIFRGGYDVDSFGNKLYVTSLTQAIDVYAIELLDTDGDGALEPNQHPDNADERGPVEERRLSFVETIPWGGHEFYNGQAEIFALGDRLFVGGSAISEYDFATELYTLVAVAPEWADRFSLIAFDEVNGIWYAANEDQRRVFQRAPASDTWGLAFAYPELSGTHMDGLEVVVDRLGTVFVYVSDMTSDFIGQYRKDPQAGWVQANLFSYDGVTGSPVEGMGWGALGHFWATSGPALYEIGGGDLTEYTEPAG